MERVNVRRVNRIERAGNVTVAAPGGLQAFVACGPRFGNRAVGPRIPKFETGAAAIGVSRPREIGIVSDFVGWVVLPVAQQEVTPAMRQFAAEVAQHRDVRILRAQRGGVVRNHEISVRREDGVGWEGKADGVNQPPAAQVHRCGRTVVEFDPLLVVFRHHGRGGIGRVTWRGMIQDFVDHDLVVQREQVRCSQSGRRWIQPHTRRGRRQFALQAILQLHAVQHALSGAEEEDLVARLHGEAKVVGV